MTETLTALYLKGCPHRDCFTDCPAMVTDTNVTTREHAVACREVSRHHLLRACHST